jgi:hypothetical protein
MSDQLNVIDELEQRLIEAYYGENRGRAWLPAGGRAWLPAAATAVVAVIAAIVVSLVLLPGGGVTPSTAHAALEQAANASATGPDDALRPGKLWYVRVITSSVLPAPPPTQAAGFPTHGITIQSVRDVWLTIDGSMRIRSEVRDLPARDSTTPKQVISQRSSGHGVLASPLIPVLPLISYRQLRTLPTSPARLLRAIARLQAKLSALGAPRPPTTTIGSATGHKGTGTTLTGTGTGTVTAVGTCCGSTASGQRAASELSTIALLLAMPVTPAVRAALYRAAASFPGVRYDGTASDSLGRRGVEISVGSGEDAMRMIFNERSGTLLGSSLGFGATLGFGRTVQTIATEKVVSASR